VRSHHLYAEQLTSNMVDSPVNTSTGYSVNATNVQDFVRQLVELRDNAGLSLTKLSGFICDCKCDSDVVQEKLNHNQQLDDYHELVSVQNELETYLGRQMKMFVTLTNKLAQFSDMMTDYVTLDDDDDDVKPDTTTPAVTSAATVDTGTKGKKKSKRPDHLAAGSTGKKMKINE